jgi:hypothetical protein
MDANDMRRGSTHHAGVSHSEPMCRESNMRASHARELQTADNGTQRSRGAAPLADCRGWLKHPCEAGRCVSRLVRRGLRLYRPQNLM